MDFLFCHQLADQFAGLGLGQPGSILMTDFSLHNVGDLISREFFLGNQGEDHFLLPARHGRR